MLLLEKLMEVEGGGHIVRGLSADEMWGIFVGILQ